MAIISDAPLTPDETDDPHAQYQRWINLGSMYEGSDQTQQALAAYREALRWSLQTDDPVAAGCARGHVVRLSLRQRQTKHRRRDKLPDS
jgi:hypothetical protein